MVSIFYVEFIWDNIGTTDSEKLLARSFTIFPK
jgi:hypothetical protein